MLGPSINVVQTLLTDALNETMRMDSFAQTTNNIMIGKLPKDPDWLASVRSRVAMLGQAGASWLAAKPDIWSSVLVQFTDYATSFAGVAELQKNGQLQTAQQWIDVLSSVLEPQLQQAVTATSVAAQGLQTHLQAFQNIQPLLTASINQGWSELGDEERQMTAIAAQLAHLQDLVQSLEESVTGVGISTGKSVMTTTVTTLYNVATEVSSSFSFLSMAAAAFTVTKTYYDIITSTDEVADTLQQIGALQIQASEEAQAAAGTKITLQLLYNLELSLGRIVDILPQLSTMWSNEQQKLQAVITALQAGVEPANYLELITIPTANSNWAAINSFALAIPALKNAVGPPVLLDPQKPLTRQP